MFCLFFSCIFYVGCFELLIRFLSDAEQYSISTLCGCLFTCMLVCMYVCIFTGVLEYLCMHAHAGTVCVCMFVRCVRTCYACAPVRVCAVECEDLALCQCAMTICVRGLRVNLFT